MKKNFKTMAAAIAVTGTMAMTMGMSMSAFAASNLNTSNTVSSDTTSINLIKDYDRADETQTNSNSPEETFTFTITPYAVWNAGTIDGNVNSTKYAVDNIPLLGTTTGDVVHKNETERKTTVNIKVPAENAGGVNLEQAISIPEYKSVGDFWYQVVETDNKTTGVNYATNDASEIDRTYFIHVQVINGTTKDTYLRSVTLHKTAPDANITNAAYNDATSFYNTSNKVDAIQNTYSAGEVKVKKVVTGNAGDKNKRFGVTVTFIKPVNTILTSDITYSAYVNETDTAKTDVTILGQDDANSIWTTAENGSTKIAVDSDAVCYAKVKVWLKSDETVTFSNVPYGVTYKVDEDNYSSLKYDEPVYYYTDESKKVDSVLDEVTITNNKDVTIDVGVLLSNAPYAAMLALAGTAGVVFVKRRKKDIED